MTDTKDRIEAAIRHIQTATDVDPWAMELAVDALKAQIDKDINVPSEDTISRQEATGIVLFECGEFAGLATRIIERFEELPSANPDLSGYSDRLWKRAYDRGYEKCRQDAIDVLMKILDRPNHAEFLYTDEICRALGQLPSAQPEPSQVARDIATIIENEQDMRVIAQAEIIHCKDCINCSRDAIYDDYWCDGREVTADHYCGYAERRTE